MKINFLTHKLLPILSIFILILFVFSVSCFASVDLSYNDKVYTVPDYDDLLETNRYLIFLNNYDEVFLVVYVKDYMLTCRPVERYGYTDFYYPPFGYSKVYTLNSSGNWYLYTDCSDISGSNITYMKHCFYVTDNIYDKDTGELVFQGAPQVVIPEITKALVEQTTQLGMKPLEIIKVVLPIVIITIVGLIAFWKAWQLLLKQLRKA